MRITLLILVFILFAAAIYGELSDSSRSEFLTRITQQQNRPESVLFMHSLISWTVGVALFLLSLGTRPLKNRKGESGTSDWVEVYTVPDMKAHFRLAFDLLLSVCSQSDGKQQLGNEATALYVSPFNFVFSRKVLPTQLFTCMHVCVEGESTSVIVLYVNLNDVAQLHKIILKFHLSFLVFVCMQIAAVGELIHIRLISPSHWTFTRTASQSKI